MYEAKTKPTNLSFTSYLNGIEDPQRRADCKVLASLMQRITGCKPKMWGPSIVGFDAYHYRYPSGHEGDMCVVGFSSRKSDLTVYLSGFEGKETKALLAQLGKHKLGKVCLYIKRLADVQLPVLEKLIMNSVADTKRRYPDDGN